jgi:hypothetical protein
MTDKTLRESADELTPIDNLYDANQRLRAENERLRQHDKEATDLTIDQQAEIGRLATALAHHHHLAWGHCDYCG